ncbi:gamma-tubulin complex component 6 [Macrosteles quadrilineatus]|uniref:gamma-tubulin complex component 6 n=1 Tax=Macrosteles quadrilineatus TaxID=74068 RepID=UPI0023E215E6|nr:gamma-tubulin complex component 6 [Macrosteles quadrilineatus]
MEDSTFNLITGLCSDLVEDTLHCCANKEVIIKSLRSKAFEIVLNVRNTETEDELEGSPQLLLANILDHVYSKAKAKGQWTELMFEHVDHVLDRAETLAEANPSFVSVLKFLIHLANTVPTSGTIPHQKHLHGAEMKISITDHSFKHEPLIDSDRPFSPTIFKVPSAARSETIHDLQAFAESPGTGLKHEQFFNSSINALSMKSRRFEEDINNGNWFNSKINNMNIPVDSSATNPRFSMHQDEGYVTPDQDLIENEDLAYIPWEDMVDDFNLVYGWKNFGSVATAKEPQFVLERRDSVNQIGRVIHASCVVSSRSAKSNTTTLTTVSLQELEVAFKNLLVGVESSIFLYDKDRKSFVLQKGLCLKELIPDTLEEYCEDFIECGNNFRQLSKVTELSRKYGLVFQVLCNNIRQYLRCYRGVVLEMTTSQSLLETRDWLHRLSSQMQFLISLCPLKKAKEEKKTKDILVYLCDKMPVLYRQDLSFVYHYILQSCFTVYFTFLSKWIFEGVSDSLWSDEFFIRSNPLTEDMYNRTFWSKGFVLDHELVPNCLKGLETKLLLCGKSMALLKLCAIEDPICKLVKRHRPEIVCCFNSVDLAKVEETFDSYKGSYKSHCLQLYGNTTPESHDEQYYADRMAKTLDEIKGRQEEERRLKAEKKHIQFNILKKEMEDAQARKIEEKRITIEKEKKLMEEAKEIDEMDDLRRQEEREKIMQYYNSLSEAADRRRDRAEWKIKRAELHHKRCAYWKNEMECLEKNITLEQHRKDTKLVLSEQSLEKYLKTYDITQGSGDYIPVEETSLKEASSSTLEYEKKEDEKEMEEVGGGENNRVELDDSTRDGGGDDKREWLIALDVAEQARQSALIFKQRNMHNDYNIITGVESTFESRFKHKHEDTQEPEEKTTSLHSLPEDSGNLSQTQISDLTSKINDDESNKEDKDTLEDKLLQTSLNQISDFTSENNVDGSNKDILEDKSLMSPKNTSDKFETSVNKSVKSMKQSLEMSSPSDTESLVQEIDMTSVYQNVQRSVVIPLMAQLELTSDAIVRLYNQHNLLRHIECIWKYFFLLEGEFARNLTKNLFKETQSSQHPSYLLNVMKLNSILRCAVGNNIDEEYTERLSFYVKEVPTVFRTLDPGMLDCLSLRYKTHWPINIIITDEIIAKKDQIFKHLLKLHRMSWALEETIYIMKDKKLSCSEEYRKIQLYRHIMSHFISAVKQYLTAVVVEKMWYEFKNKFQTATTVDMMYELYQYYIRSVNSKCLLGKARVHTEQLFNNLFKEVLIFYEALRSGEWIQETCNNNFRHSNFSRLNHAYDNFKKIADHLVYLFKKMSNSFPNIEQLVTTLTLNDFYKMKEKEHNQ